MGAGNDLYISPILGSELSEQYSAMFYIDEWEFEENFFDETIRDDVLALLNIHLKNFTPSHIGAKDILPYKAQWLSSCVLGQVGRMAILAMPTYYGDRLMVVVTPNAEWQYRICDIEEQRIPWEDCYDQSERAVWASSIRSVCSGGLRKEMVNVHQRILKILDCHGGLGNQISFRCGPWSSARYQSSMRAI